MKTKHLDRAITYLESLDALNLLSLTQYEKLNEYREIKSQLIKLKQ